MASWEIHLFGPPRVEHDGKVIAVSRRKTVALLAYLSVELRPHSREALAAVMWPEHTAAQAKANLRRDLSRLKNVLSDDVFEVDRTQAALDPDGNWWLDVRVFQEYIQLLRSHNHFPEEYCAECLEAAKEAVQLYDADFMAGFTLPDSPEYDEWQFFKRESLRQSLVELLQRLVGWHTGQGEFEHAIEYGRRWLAMDLLHEPAHRELMRLYAWAGQQAAAIRQYEECVRHLDEELGVPPEPETEELYELIFARKLPPPTVKKPVLSIKKPVVSMTPPPSNERYETGELLAEGGHGEVYLGRDKLADVQVVIKRIKPELLTAESELLTRFQQEGEILARLNHPNIVRMLDTFQHEGQYNIVMEYVPGGSLRQLLNRNRQLEIEEAVTIGLELADALSRAHHLGIIHRDLKPENILMAEDGTPRLTDFGVAYLKRANSRLTRTGTILGSPDYISPEIIQEGEIDGRSDIWSLGVVLYEMLVGKTPFDGNQIVTVLFNIVNEQELSLFDIRPDLPVHLVSLIHNMLKKDPDERPDSMRQVAAVLEAIREGRVPESPSAYLTPGKKSEAFPVKKVVPPKIETPHILPRQTTSFIGREEELFKIRRLLVEEASCRLLTLVGPSGIGKTRLAIEAAYRMLDGFPDGVYFVSLASVGSVDLIIPAIAETLHFQFSGPATPKAQLIHCLRPKKMLLVIDQLEQPLEGGQILSQILRLVPNVSFLVTVRERLQLTEEWSYEIPGLSLPEKTTVTDRNTLETFSAAHLFIQRARRARADFSLQSDDIAYVIEICGLLNCSPLGLEIIAPWVRSFSLLEIASRIKEKTNQISLISENGSIDLSLKAVFAEAWSMISTAEQKALRRLTVFQGGCTQEAAVEITGASIKTLNALMDKALIRQDSDERYELHNLIRLFAGERLKGDPEEHEVIYDIHCRYYLSFLEQQTPALKVNQDEQILAAMAADIGNLRAAWEWAVKYLLLEDLSPAAQGYWLYHRFQGLLYEGESIFRQTADTLINTADEEFDSVAIEQLAGFLKVGQGDFMARRGWLVEGINEIEVGLELMRQDGDFDESLEAFALTALAWAQLERGFFADAQLSAQQSLELLPRRDGLWTRAVCLQLLGSVAINQGRLDTAEILLQSCLDICNELGVQELQLEAKIGLSMITRLRGQYGRSQQWLDEVRELNQPLKDRLNMVDLLREQGVLALIRGQTDLARQNLEESKAICETIGHTDGGKTDVYLGCYYQQQGDLERANDFYRQGLALAKAASYESGIAYAQLHIGLLALEQGQLNQAEQYMQDALATWQDMENEGMIAQTLRGLGDISVQVGEQRAADARSYYRQALQLAVKNNLAPTGLKTILGLAPLLVRSGEIHRAIRLLILTEQHPAGSFMIKWGAQQFLNSFPEDEVTAVRRETISMDWIETTESLITELAAAVWGQKPVHHNLPIHRTEFFGRQAELLEIQDYLLASKSRLISIIGPGGIGKTSLAIAAGVELASEFPQGVFLVPLAPLETADQIFNTLAEILGIQNLVTENPRQQLLNYLKRKKILLIFDNYEQLLPDVDLIASIVENAPDVQIIVTTRQRLNLGAELVYTLKGMTYPTLTESDPVSLNNYDAVQLLVGHARLARPDYTLELEDYENIVRICNLVEGMPLALVLATSWLDMLSFAEIAEEIAESLDFLESERGDLPPRQRSVRAVFNGSWSRLPAAAQATFARLTVFRGGFTREAARAVCKTSLRDLRTLVNNSFVTVSADGRYGVHELMRQLGAEQLEAMGTAAAAKTDHSNYYLSFLNKQESDLKGGRQIEALEEIIEDFDNVRSAWNWALEQGNRQVIDQAQECLHIFFDVQGRYLEGRAFFAKAKEVFMPPPGQKGDSIYGRILTRYAFLGSIIDQPRDPIRADLEQGLAIAEANNNQTEIALANLALGTLLDNPETDLQKFAKAQEIYEQLNDDFYRTRVYLAIANCHGYLQDLHNFKSYIYDAVHIARSTGNVLNLSIAVANLSEVELAFGQYQQAYEYVEESLSLAHKVHAWLLVSYCHCISGFNCLLSGDFVEAEAGGRKALAQAEEIDHLYLKAFSLAVLSIWAGLTGETESGLKWGEVSAGIQENNMLGLILAPWGLSINYARLGRWEDSAKALMKAFEQSEAQKLPAPMVWLIGMAALIAAEKGEGETAVHFLSISMNHPLRAIGWMEAWSRLAGLKDELKEQLGEEKFEAVWIEAAAHESEILPPDILASVYELLKKD